MERAQWKEFGGPGKFKKNNDSKELYQLSKEQKKALFDQFSAELAKNKKNMKSLPKYKKRKASNDTDSDMDLSVNMMERIPKKAKRAKDLEKFKKLNSNDAQSDTDGSTTTSVGEISTAEERSFMMAISHKNE